MYERKIAEDFECGINVALKVFCSKWKPCIIDSVNRGYLRPTQLHQLINEAPPRVIDIHLKELTEAGVLSKKVSPGFPLKVEYFLTNFGESILPVIKQMDEWGTRHREFVLDRIGNQ